VSDTPTVRSSNVTEAQRRKVRGEKREEQGEPSSGVRSRTFTSFSPLAPGFGRRTSWRRGGSSARPSSRPSPARGGRLRRSSPPPASPLRSRRPTRLRGGGPAAGRTGGRRGAAPASNEKRSCCRRWTRAWKRTPKRKPRALPSARREGGAAVLRQPCAARSGGGGCSAPGGTAGAPNRPLARPALNPVRPRSSPA
jgi:hypothetical protein